MPSASYSVAGWRFDPGEPVLRNGVREVRLEDRAARTLAVLCEHRGEVVSREMLISRVWGGRTVSPNSVSIVIGSLRRALDDNAETPIHIVTIARRGYRLAEEAAVNVPRGDVGRPKWVWLALGAILVALATGTLFVRRAPSVVSMVVEPPRNATGRPALDTLAVSLTPVVIGAAADLPSVRVLDIGAHGSGTAPKVILRSQLVMWNGAPELALSVVESRTGAIVWTGFAAGPPEALARHVAARVRTMEPRLPR